MLRTPDRITTLRPGSGKNGRKMAVFVRGRPSSCFRLSGPETDFRNGRAERPDACRSGVRGRDGAIRRRCVRIAGRGRVLRTGTKGGLYAGGTFPGVGSERPVVPGRGRPMGQRAGIAKEGRSASRRPERPVAGKSVAGNLPREARIGPGKTKSGKDRRFGVRPFAADAFYGGLAVSRLPAGGSDIGVFPPVFCRLTRKSRHGCGLSPERVLSWLRRDGVGLLPPAPESMSSEREGRKDGLGRLSNRTRRAGCFRSV